MNIVFLLMLNMYQYSKEPFWYATFVYWIVISIYYLCCFIMFYRKSIFLDNIKEQLLVSTGVFPENDNPIEQKYQELLDFTIGAYRKEISNKDLEYNDMLEYYTLWAHQIKTPIAAMRLLLQQERQTKFSQDISDELFHIERYVEMVLQYIRVGRINNDLLIQEYELDSIIKQAVNKYTKVFIRKKISLDYSNVNIKVITDEKWLLFVLEQILSNALKYTKKGTVKIYLEPNRDKVLVIEDSGIGIKEEDLPRIFEKGYTGYNGRLDKKSSGIGLYLSKAILTNLSHNIDVESIPKRGTRILIDLHSYPLRD